MNDECLIRETEKPKPYQYFKFQPFMKKFPLLFRMLKKMNMAEDNRLHVVKDIKICMLYSAIGNLSALLFIRQYFLSRIDQKCWSDQIQYLWQRPKNQRKILFTRPWKSKSLLRTRFNRPQPTSFSQKKLVQFPVQLKQKNCLIVAGTTIKINT